MAFEKIKEIIKTTPVFAGMMDLAAEKLGGKVLFCTDDFFAEKENLLKPGRGIFIADKYTDRGKWMDGWESRRKRTPGHDWAVVRLAAPGSITGFDIDTNFFLGNHPPFASIEAVYLKENVDISDWNDPSIDWKEVLPKSPLDAGSQNFYESTDNNIFTHIRLHIYPDGGVARLRVYGKVYKNWEEEYGESIDLASALNGATPVSCNDMFFSDMKNLLMPGRGINMGDGWETKRNRTPGNRDWVIIQLATKGVIEKVLIDTCHFKGNYPDSFSLEGCNYDGSILSGDDAEWQTILPQQKLSADAEHKFDVENKNVYSHIRLNIFPDGGISRMRLFGKKA